MGGEDRIAPKGGRWALIFARPIADIRRGCYMPAPYYFRNSRHAGDDSTKRDVQG